MGDKKAKEDGERYILCDVVLPVGRYLDEPKWAVPKDSSPFPRLFYTEESESLAPVIDDFTLQREFIVFDLRRFKSDPLSIQVRWDTSLNSITDQSQFDPSSISVQSQSESRLITVRSKFSPYGQKAVAEAKKSSQLVEFAQDFPSPKERKLLLISSITVKNADTWIKYVF
ncbi:hypothetical protein RhiirA1_477882 [Rhizophagus irregularis]|uniref:Uncharacterized protein n=1 Tax=Rhizophagus irregularis TaxID=588596 RepID=A0A2N0QT03_9GLOM|nr:hypothetical protein RhiirA1_477882 [Rhizophagus irregularis]